MTLKIQPLPGLGFTVFILTGQLKREHLVELQSLLQLKTACEDFVLDLKELKLVDQEGICFLEQREAEGMELRNCPPYVRKSISQRRSRRLAGGLSKTDGSEFERDNEETLLGLFD